MLRFQEVEGNHEVIVGNARMAGIQNATDGTACGGKAVLLVQLEVEFIQFTAERLERGPVF